MTTIEDKIKLFSRIIYEQIQEEKQEEFDNFERDRVDKLEENRRRIELKYKQNISETIKKAGMRANEIVSKEKIAVQRNILALKEALIQETIDAIKSLLLEFCASEEYSQLLFHQIQSIASSLDSGTYILYLTDRDRQRFESEIRNSVCHIKDLTLRVEAVKQDIIGGVIIEDDGHRFRFDSSFSTKLKEYKQCVGTRVMEALK